MRRGLIALLVAMAMTAPLIVMASDYDRDRDFGRWIDQDGDCQDTRAEILIRDSLIPVTLSSSGCGVEVGLWVCPYTGTITTDPRDLDIEHIVPLKTAYESGASEWTKERRVLYANDLSGLLAVTLSSNRSKSNRGPSQWIPPNLSYLGTYLSSWGRIKMKWDLQADSEEMDTMARLYRIADETRIGTKLTDDGDLELLYTALRD